MLAEMELLDEMPLTLEDIAKRKTEEAREKFRSERRLLKKVIAGSHGDAAKAESMPDEITVRRTGIGWSATTAKLTRTGDTPEQAIARLSMCLRIAVRSPADLARDKRFVRGISTPTCNVQDFNIKPDLDSEYRYQVDFTSSVRLLRGDIERLFPAMMRTHGGQDDKCDDDGE